MNTRWMVRRINADCPGCDRPYMWRVSDSFGDYDSDYCDWESAVVWAASPSMRVQYYANGGVL